MRLSSLKLAGFKSFADATTLHFKDKRTAVVGPNGCGKSNVIDAIRWVMGESSAKQLRGGNMQDVIFAGTAQRKPVGVASVELRFENTYGQLGGAYNAYHELSVKRQVTREGKSDYFLNGTRCRRKDITDIFLGTGLGPRSYAVIEQGMINRLVDAKPDEMRVFIEEAAGISRYQMRRKETLQHLEHTQNNLARLNDIAIELATQIKTLERQAEQAQKYQRLTQEIKNHQIQLLSLQYQQTSEKVVLCTHALTQLSADYQTQLKQREQVEIEERLVQQQLQRKLPLAEEYQKTWQHAEQQHQKMTWQVRQVQENRAKLEKNMLNHQQAQRERQETLVEIKRKQVDLQTQLQNLKQQQQQLSLAQEAADIDLLEQDFEQKQTMVQQAQQDIMQQQQQQQQLQYQHAQVEKVITRAEQALQQLTTQQNSTEQEDLALELDELNIELHQLQAQKNTLQQLQQQQEKEATLAQQKLNDMTQKRQMCELQAQQIQRDILQTETILAKLTSSDTIPALNPLLSQLELSYQGQKYVAWIEKILAQWLLAEWVEHFDMAYAGARQLKAINESKHKVTHLELPTIETWIKTPQHPLWQHIYLAEHLEEAVIYVDLLAPHESIVTEDGYWLTQHWWVNLNIDVQDMAQGQLHYQQHIKAQKESERQLEQQRHCLEEELKANRECSQNATEKLQGTVSTLQVLNEKIQVIMLQQSKVQALQVHQIETQQHIVQQCLQLEQQLADDIQEREQLQIDIVAIQLRLEQKQPALAQQQAQFAQVKHRYQQRKTAYQLQQQQAQQLQLAIQQLQTQIALLQQDGAFQQQQFEQQDEQILAMQQQLAALQQKYVQYSAQAQQDLANTQLAQQQWSAWQIELEQLQQQQQQLQEQRLVLQQREYSLRDELERARTVWQLEKNIQQNMLSQLKELGVHEALDVNQNADVIQSLLEKAQQQLTKIGAINLAAADELQLLQQRYDELTHQTADLEQTIAQLQAAMKSIDQETKQLFMKTFAQINQELQDLFPKVFSGGEASLSLEDDWQSGVRLMARPPGKRNSTLALLSGGEKALTALALVFAIFRLNPAPFCVLDEVDAPLDDANVNRFCNLVKELSEQVQFIYITHNKVAMTMATDLLGVTMPDAGSSKLVAVSLAQAEAYI